MYESKSLDLARVPREWIHQPWVVAWCMSLFRK
jgi:hypothetical protein